MEIWVKMSNLWCVIYEKCHNLLYVKSCYVSFKFVIFADSVFKSQCPSVFCVYVPFLVKGLFWFSSCISIVRAPRVLSCRKCISSSSTCCPWFPFWTSDGQLPSPGSPSQEKALPPKGQAHPPSLILTLFLLSATKRPCLHHLSFLKKVIKLESL